MPNKKIIMVVNVQDSPKNYFSYTIIQQIIGLKIFISNNVSNYIVLYDYLLKKNLSHNIMLDIL